MRAVYYALGLPFGRLDRACVDCDAVSSISLMRQPPRSRRSSKSGDNGTNPKSVVVKRVYAPPRILRVLRRARHVISALTRVPMIPIHAIPRRRVVIQS